MTRLGSFDPVLIAKHQRRLPGFDDPVIGMYSHGMSVREIQGHLLELYALEVSPEVVSTITDELLAEVAQWQGRSLEFMSRLSTSTRCALRSATRAR